MIDLSQEDLAILLLHSFLCGASFGVVYEMIRAFKLLCGVEDYCGEHKKSAGFMSFFAHAVTFVTDLMFWAGAACVSILLTYAEGGFFRGMTYIGIFGGFLAYYFTLGRIILRLNRKIMRKIKKALAAAMPYLLRPVKFMFGRIILLYHLTIGKIIDKIIEDRKKRSESEAEQDISDEDAECGKEDFVYVGGKTGYRRVGRVSFGQKSK